jgi:hypothetical protein
MGATSCEQATRGLAGRQAPRTLGTPDMSWSPTWMRRAGTRGRRCALRKPPRAERSPRSAARMSAGFEQRRYAADAGPSAKASEGGVADRARRDAGWTSRVHRAPVSMRRGILGSQPARPSRPSVDISGHVESPTGCAPRCCELSQLHGQPQRGCLVRIIGRP